MAKQNERLKIVEASSLPSGFKENARRPSSCPRLSLLVAGIHVFLSVFQCGRRGWPGRSPAMTTEVLQGGRNPL
jgi:hypothetical protein